MKIRVFDIKDGITKLGPGVRFGLWTQGCLRKCPGCMSPDSQPLDAGYLMEVDSLVDKIKKSNRTGLTISGGEPFLQADALAELIKKLRQTVDIGVIIYTGYTIEELKACNKENFKELLAQSDMIVDGEYIDALNDGKNFRGSSNQRAIPLTKRYEEFAKEFGTRPAEVEFFYHENGISMVGVPSRELLTKFKNTIF